jgi:hypothetical protein
MKKNLRLRAVTALAVVAAVVSNSCAYDPYHTSVGSSYSTGYGDGYGYGGRTFSTSVFVGTGDPRWGYDPYCHSYFDYRRRAYYDPYLNGYYPVGYRPRAVYGVAHPHGWQPGRGYCRPPSRVTNVTIRNYQNRESAYRKSGHIPSGRNYSLPPGREVYDRANLTSQAQARQAQKNKQASKPDRPPSGQGRYRRNDDARQSARYPSQYQTPVAARQQEFSGRGRYDSTARQKQNAQRQIRQIAPPDQSRPPQRQQRTAPARNQRPQPQNASAAGRGSKPNKQKGDSQNGASRWGGRTGDE